MNKLKNKKILITAGPTWVPIDSVRIISNIATGKTGILLAEKLTRLGANVTLLLGAVETSCLNKKIRLRRFKFFDELKDTVIKELGSKKYDIVIHSAAVSDYKPQRTHYYKIKSGLRNWKLNLVPTIKIIDLIKRINKNIFLVGFKFESHSNRNKLIKEAREFFKRCAIDLLVANTVKNNKYQACIISKTKTYGYFSNKKALTEGLIEVLKNNFNY